LESSALTNKETTDVLDTETPAQSQYWPGFARTSAAAGPWKRGAAGVALAWPWLDDVITTSLKRGYFPLSRMWAAAQLADGDPKKFIAAVPLPPGNYDHAKLARALARIAEARATAQAIDTQWHVAFFGPATASTSELAALEAARLDARHAYNASRRHLVGWLNGSVPRIALSMQSPAVIGESYADFQGPTANAYFAAPTIMPQVAQSPRIPGAVGLDSWLSFPSPSSLLGDTVFARIHEPIGITNPPTVILGHGICVEFDHWRGLIDESDALCRAGLRVIRPEAPWHGRRNPTGYYGGERLIGAFPMGLLDAATGAMQEWAVMANWARSTSTGKLGFGGTSLGAQFAQMAATKSLDWPAHLRPDALLLVTHCGSMADALFEGQIAEIFGIAENAVSAGWTPELVRPYLRHLDPDRTPPIPPSQIISVLGRRDKVTPFESGRALIEDWCIPAANTHIWDRGHFSVLMQLITNQRPVQQFADLLKS
jgi:hypothetical protein